MRPVIDKEKCVGCLQYYHHCPEGVICAGCGGSFAVRISLKVLGERPVAVLQAGCMSAVGFNFPQLCFGNNAIISTFAGTASMLTGIEAGLRAQGITDFHAVGFAGDGGYRYSGFVRCDRQKRRYSVYLLRQRGIHEYRNPEELSYALRS